MELFLNVLWVLIAAGLLWTWRTRWVHERRRKHERPLQEWTAVGVALILLFFAVSMTDDLHADLVLFDECSTSRRGSSVELHAHRVSVHSKVEPNGLNFGFFTSVASSFAIPHFVAVIAPFSEAHQVAFSGSNLTGRAPPSLIRNA